MNKRFVTVEEANEFWEKRKKTWKVIGICLWTGVSLGTLMLFATILDREIETIPVYIPLLSAGLAVYISASCAFWISSIVKGSDED